MLHRRLVYSILVLVMISALLSPASSAALAAPLATTNLTPEAQEAPAATNTNRDTFASTSYSNNNGSQNWAGNWTETNDDGSAGSGDIQITAGELRIDNSTGGAQPLIARGVNSNLSTALWANLSFEYRTTNLEYADELAVEISADGGTNWTTLEVLHGDNDGSKIYGINQFISANTRIRFRVNNALNDTGEFYYLDNVQVQYDTAARKTYFPAGWVQGFLGDNNNRPGQTCSDPMVHYFLVYDDFQVTDLNVGLNVTHSDRGDIRVDLEAPDRTTVRLIVDTSGDTNDDYDVTLDDSAAGVVHNGANDNVKETYYDRQARPQNALSAFNGKNSVGPWKLTVCDANQNGVEGRSNHAALFFTGTDNPAPLPPTPQNGPAPVQVFYIPFPEDQVLQSLTTIYPQSGSGACGTASSGFTFNALPKNPVVTVAGVSIAADNTWVYYDHWEDGFEVDLSNPTQQSTRIWGNGDPNDGIAPEADGGADDILEAGDVLILKDVVLTIELGQHFDYNAGDRVGVTNPSAMTRISWATGSSTLFTGDVEMFPTSEWGTGFELPVGQNDNVSDMFDYVGVSVMASDDGTVVQIDTDNNGTTDVTCNLNEGKACQVNGGMDLGATINSNHPVQVSLITADTCANYETRWSTLIPTERWDNEYFVPVGAKTTSAAANPNGVDDDTPAYAHVYNPGTSSITVDWETQGGAQTAFSVPAGGRVNRTIPAGEGARFRSRSSGATTRTYLDQFTLQAYNNSNGTENWTSSPWVEVDNGGGGASGGNVYVDRYEDRLEFNINPSGAVGNRLTRQANLSAATGTVTLSFYYSNSGNLGSADDLEARISGNGGTTWRVLETFDGNSSAGTRSYTLQPGEVSSNTTIRFIITNHTTSNYTEQHRFDDVQLSWQASTGAPPPFLVLVTVDSDPASGSDPDRNDTVDWGFPAVPEAGMSKLVQVGIGWGYDPEYTTPLTTYDNASPVWLTAWNSGASTTVCVDYNADGNGPAAGGGTDPSSGREYDQQFTVAQLDSLIIYDNSDGDNNPDTGDRDQSAMILFVCNNSSGIIAAAWGQDSNRSFPGRPAQDNGTLIPNQRGFATAKDAELAVDVNGNGLYDPGDSILYTILVKNTGTTVIPAGTLRVQDSVPADTEYVAGSTEYVVNNVVTSIPDAGTAPVFPLEPANGGFTYPQSLAVGAQFEVRFKVTIDVPVCITVYNEAHVTDGTIVFTPNVEVPCESPVFGAIGNYVWVDENSDGYQDAGEPGIPNVRVQLYDTTGNVVDTTWTDAHGGYLFPNLSAGSYFVRVDSATIPMGMIQTPIYPNPNADFGNQDQSTGANDYGYPVSIGNGQPLENLTADFGYNANPAICVNEPNNPACNDYTASLGDRVWIDVDGDGAQDPEEVGVRGATVQLFSAGPDDIFGTPDDVPGPVDVTDADGYYLFDNLAPGAYVVKVVSSSGASHEVLGAGYTQTGDPDHFGTTGANNDNQTTTPVILGPGDVFLNADFGYQPTPGTVLGSIGDLVWFDSNASGTPTPDAGEYGIPGVTVALIRDTNGDGAWDADGADNTVGTADDEPIIATDTTDAGGTYLFGGLSLLDSADGNPNDADYIVWVNDTRNVLAGLTETYDADAPLDGLSSAALTAGAPNDLSNDFSYTPVGHTPTLGLIGDTVWFDVDGSGGTTQGSEPGIESVVMQLYGPGPDGTFGTPDDVLLSSTTTDENGHYYFGSLPVSAGGTSYQVRVADSSLAAGGVLQGMTNSYAAGASLGNVGPVVTLTNAAPNNVNLLQDFSYKVQTAPGGSIGNLIWEDLNANGFQDAGESGINGVTVDLYRDLNGNGKVDPGEPLVGSQTTSGSGAYLFTGLPTTGNGATGGAAYIVDVTDVAGKLAGYWHSLSPNQDPYTNGGNDAAANSKIEPVGVEIGGARPVDNLNADFGYYVKPAALGNFVWEDLDHNGIQDAGEPGIDGVVVTLVITWPNNQTTSLKVLTGNDPSTPETEAGWYGFGNLLLDEDYRLGSPSSTPGVIEPAHLLTVAAPPGKIVTPVQVMGSTQFNDSNDPLGTIGVPQQGMTNVSFSQNGTTPASYDFGFYTPEQFDPNPFDWGDLPSPYPTLLVNNGPRHTASNRLFLGMCLDAEINGQPSATAVGDDNSSVGMRFGNCAATNDEDGVTKVAGLNGSSWSNGTVATNKGGALNIVIGAGTGVPQLFMDFDQDSTLDALALYYDDDNNSGTPLIAYMGTPLSAGSRIFYFDIPANINLETPIATRVRLSSTGGLGATGSATSGEVEDYFFKEGPLAVDLAAFEAAIQASHILVTWETVSELDNAGFNLYRATSADGERMLLGSIAAQAPGSTQGASYSYHDADVQEGQTYWYWLEDVDISGAATLHGPVSATFQAPLAVTLHELSADTGASHVLPLGTTGLALLLILAAAWATQKQQHTTR